VVLFDADFDGGGSWQELLQDDGAATRRLVVVSKHPSVELWAEALNLGGFDVLELPFVCDELERVVGSALRHAADASRT
jgi:DNA-binding NtrC family response regulator